MRVGLSLSTTNYVKRAVPSLVQVEHAQGGGAVLYAERKRDWATVQALGMQVNTLNRVPQITCIDLLLSMICASLECCQSALLTPLGGSSWTMSHAQPCQGRILFEIDERTVSDILQLQRIAHITAHHGSRPSHTIMTVTKASRVSITSLCSASGHHQQRPESISKCLLETTVETMP